MIVIANNDGDIHFLGMVVLVVVMNGGDETQAPSSNECGDDAY